MEAAAAAPGHRPRQGSMKILRLRLRADRCSIDAVRSQTKFRDHAARSSLIVRRLLTTPLGLSMCFGLGAAVGAGMPPHSDEPAYGKGKQKFRRTTMLAGDVGTRVASALIAGVLMNAVGDVSDHSTSQDP
jgi:hypothetical protein